MSMLSSRAAKWIVPIWLIVVGLIGLLGIPLTSATSVLLISVGLVAPTIMLSFWNHLPRSPSFDISQTTLMPVAAAAIRRNRGLFRTRR
jgi:hypothetical protein